MSGGEVVSGRDTEDGSHTLRVCLSRPSDNSQPTIAADGAPYDASEYAAYGVTYGCFESTLIGPLPGSGVAGSKATITLPSNKLCLSLRLFKIHLLEPN